MERPKKSYELLGDDVLVTREVAENDGWAQQMLQEIGKTMTPAGFSYIGSAAVHFYSTHENTVLGEQQAQVKHQFALGELSEAFAAFGTQEFVRQFGQQFGKRQRTNDQRVKDETV